MNGLFVSRRAGPRAAPAHGAALAAAAILSLAAQGCGPDGDGAAGGGDLAARVADRLDALDAASSLWALHVPTGREIAIRADVPMNTLSVIKVPIMAQAFRDAAEGRLDLDERHEVGPDDMRRGSGLLQSFAPGLAPTLRDLVTQMIVTSDNTATDMVIGLVGMERVNEMLAAHGYADTRLKHATHRLFLETWIRTDPANAALSEREVFEMGFPSDEGAPERFFAIEGDSAVWLGRTTAREMGRFLRQILDGELADRAASDEMVEILAAQFYSSRLPRRVRFRGVRVAHKTGDWPPYAGNDVGILFHDGGPTIVSVFTNQSRGDFFELEETLGLIAQDIVEAWGGDESAAPEVAERPFPAPTGPHPVGMTERRWVDESRPEPFTRDPDDRRSVAVRIWYPAAEGAAGAAGDGGGAPYVPDLAEFGDGQEFVGLTHVRTNAALDAEAAPGPFPVLAYHHGGGWTRFTSTFTAEEMASRGYVVVSAGHNGFNRTQVLPGGGSVAPDTLKLPDATGDLLEDARHSWAFLDEHVFPAWVADAVFVLDQLPALNGEGLLAGRLDLDRIGAYGWSFGGAAAIELLVVDERVKAAMDHDGQLFGSAPARGVDRPFMLLHGGEMPEAPYEDPDSAAAFAEALERLMAVVDSTDGAFKAASGADWHDIDIAGTNHGSFSDLVLLMPGMSPGIDPGRGHEIVNALTAAFFDHYLKGEEAPLLDDPGAVYPEVEAESRRGAEDAPTLPDRPESTDSMSVCK